MNVATTVIALFFIGVMISGLSEGLPVPLNPAVVRPMGKNVAVVETPSVFVYVQVRVSVPADMVLTDASTLIWYVELAVGVYLLTAETVAV